MRHAGRLLAALTLLSGCGSAIGPNQADGAYCNFAAAESACGAASFCDPGGAYFFFLSAHQPLSSTPAR